MNKDKMPLSEWVKVYEQFRPEIIDIATKYGVEIAQIFGRTREAEIIFARDEVVKLIRRGGLSYPAGGRFLNRDHSTLIHALKKQTITESNLAESIETLVFPRGDSEQAAREAGKVKFD